jgi:hypothetical protein
VISGTCVGAVPANGCQYRGWTPAWLPPRAEWDQFIATLLNDPDENLCPYCVLDRAVAANIPGFSNQKRNRIRAKIGEFFCLTAHTAPPVGHTHLPRYQDENMLGVSRNAAPAPGERFVD